MGRNAPTSIPPTVDLSLHRSGYKLSVGTALSSTSTGRPSPKFQQNSSSLAISLIAMIL